MFWIGLILVLAFVLIFIRRIRHPNGDLLDPREAALIAILVGIVCIVAGFIGIACRFSSREILKCREQVDKYNSGECDTYDELANFKKDIDHYNTTVKMSREKFLVWPFGSEWKDREEMEYPEDLPDRMGEALKKEKLDPDFSYKELY